MDKIRAILLLEMLGKPKDYLQESMVALLERLSKEKGLRVINKSLNEPRSVEGSKELLTTFSEVEIEFDAIENLLSTMFAYMPSHVEVISPDKITLTNAHLGELVSVLIQRLHNYDAIVKKTLTDKENLLIKLKEVAPQLFKAQDSASESGQKKESKEKPNKKSSKK